MENELVSIGAAALILAACAITSGVALGLLAWGAW